MTDSCFDQPALVKILFAVMVARLGGDVKITQGDIDAVAYTRFEEGQFDDGSLTFRLVERAKSS